MTSNGTGRAAIVGAGIVGLSVAWFLQEEGFAVTVYDRRDVAAGASAGNAGWLTPAFAVPLPEPAVLRIALTSLLHRDSPLRISPSALPGTWRFLAEFAARSTTRRWLAGVAGFAPINALAFSCYEALAAGGVKATVTEAPIVAAFDRADEAGPLRHELQVSAEHGQPLQITDLTEQELHAEQPLLSGRARFGLRVDGQRYLQPLEYVQSLADTVRSRGAAFEMGHAVSAAGSRPGGGARVETARRPPTSTCACWPTEPGSASWPGRPGSGYRSMAGRGYSFHVRLAEPLPAPIYLPGLRVACAHGPRRDEARGDDGVPPRRRSPGQAPHRRDRAARAELPPRRRLEHDHRPLGRPAAGHRGRAWPMTDKNIRPCGRSHRSRRGAERGSRWYQQVLGASSGHGGPE